MRGAIFFTGKYGSTNQYSRWIADETSLPVFDLNREDPDPKPFDFLLLGTSIIVAKPTIRKWLHRHWSEIKGKPILLFSVSGTETENPELREWMEENLPGGVLDQVHYVPLRGRLILNKVPWWIRLMLKFAAKGAKDPEVKQRMSHGFNFMDKASIEPILEWIEEVKHASEESVMAY